MESSHLRRDVTLEVEYDGGAATDHRVLFSGHVRLAVDGEVVHDEARESVAVDVAIAADTFDLPNGASPDEARESVAVDVAIAADTLDLPDGASPTFDAEDAARGARNHQWYQAFISTAFPQDGRQLEVVADSPNGAPGVFHLTGGTHHSMVVQQ